MEKRIRRSMEFERFKFIKSNRDIKNFLVKDLMRNMSSGGYAFNFPISVYFENGDYFIADGQHRFMAAKELKVPFYFVEGDKRDLLNKIPEFNGAQSSWGLNDYVKHFAENNDNSESANNYKVLHWITKKYNFPVSLALIVFFKLNSIAEGGSLKIRFRDDFKAGKLDFLRGIKEAETIMKRVNDIRFYSDRYKHFKQNHVFVKALIRVCSNRKYKHNRMMHRLKNGVTELSKCATGAAYVMQLQDIYNKYYKKSEKENFND